MILTDSPINKRGKADLLKRAPLAEKVSQLVKKYKGKESYVIGIEGIWGAGKTSFINLVLENFQKEEATIIKFNPWNFANQNELIEDFFTSLISSLNESGLNKNISNKLSNYARKLFKQTEIGFNPSFATPIGTFQLGMSKIGGKLSVSELRDQIDDILRNLSKKILIVIDDIDRLDKQETLLVLKMVKMTANFPNTVFLLAYDRSKVAERITENGISGEDYLKKIVQVSFTIPIPDKNALQKILFDGLNETLNTVYGSYIFNNDEQKHWEEIFHEGFKYLFVTVRDINRYLSSLRLNWSVINREDVNPVDFIAIEAIRIFAPSLYGFIAGNKNLFLNKDDLSLNFRSEARDKERKTLFESIINDQSIVPTLNRKHFDNLCRRLFPQLNFGSSSSSSYEQEWRRNRRVCADQKFYFYFQLGVPEGEVSETEIVSLLAQAKDKKDLKKHLISLDKERKLTKAIDLLLDRVREISETNAENILTSLWEIDGTVEDIRTGMFDFNDFSTQVNRLTYQILQNTIPANKRSNFLTKLLKASNNIHFSLEIMNIIEESINKGETNLILDNSEATSFRSEILKVIKSKEKSGKLSTETRLDIVLKKWFDWKNKDEVKKYIGKLISTDVGLVKLIDGLSGNVYSSNKGIFRTFSKEFLATLYPIEKVDLRIDEIKSKGVRRTKKEKEIIKLYEAPPSIW